MGAIFCNGCGALLEEAPTLLPDQRPPCPRCGSLARRFEQEVTDQIPLFDSGTATDALSVTKTDGSATIAYAQTAALTVTAHDATVQTVNAHGIPGADQVGDAIVVRGPRRVIDQLVVMGRLLEWTPLIGHLAGTSRSLWWIQLSERPTWLVLVVDETGKPIDGGIELENNQIDAFVGVAESLLPTDAGPMLLTIRDQAGEKIAGGLGYDTVEGLAAVAESLLPRHPG
jgi:hypothetical protein